MLAVLFFSACTWASYVRWANFEYRTFDLAFYAQAIWQLIHGRFEVSLLNVPLLGNHVEPIVFLVAPLFAVFQHPMLLVVVQNAALAAMGPIGYGIVRLLGFDGRNALFLAAALLITPATGYIALHEFHPEALSAPLLLLMFHARLTRSLVQHWVWFIGVLACKENMAPLLVCYCAVQAFVERKQGLAELCAWYFWPMVVAIAWFFLCIEVITPALNSGNIDYAGLYSQIGGSAGEILRRALIEPQLIVRALTYSLTHGNLVWALLFPFLCLPLLRPRWLLIGAPILLQHLLSWRSSEWTIYLHYAAPLLALFWIATVEAAAGRNVEKSFARFWRTLPLLLVLACVAGQICLGPAASIASVTTDWFDRKADRARKNRLIAKIPSEASVLAPLPYLSHLALRENLYSLHFVLKGLKTLSRSSYQPPAPTDFVLIDYRDSATFDSNAGYYHPTMKTVDGRVIPSSDQLLHNFLKRSSWVVNSSDELTLLKRAEGTAIPQISNARGLADPRIQSPLVSVTTSSDVLSKAAPLELTLEWDFQSERRVFPWMVLRLTRHGDNYSTAITKGLCAPEASSGPYEEIWQVTAHDLPDGNYSADAVFADNTKRAWAEAMGQQSRQLPVALPPIRLGDIKVSVK